MSHYPGATLRLLPEAGSQPTIRATQVILHVAVSEADSLYGYWTSPGVNLESHFYVAYSGRTEQYIDTGRSADANYTANRRPDGTGALSVETAGLGTGKWTDAQVNQIIAFIRWAHDEHGIPLRLCPGPNDPGIGWHVMFGAPGPWTPAVGKVCPGAERVAQIHNVIMPRLLEEDDMFTDDDRKTLNALAAEGERRTRAALQQIMGGTMDRVASIKTTVENSAVITGDDEAHILTELDAVRDELLLAIEPPAAV